MQSNSRKPLTDCTNKLPQQSRNNSSQSSSSSKPSLPNIPTKSIFDSLKAVTNKRAPNFNSISVGSDKENINNGNKTQLSTPRRRRRQSENVNDVGVSEVFEPQTIYVRRRSAEKRKGREAAKPLSTSSPLFVKNNPTERPSVISNAFTEEHATEFNAVGVGSSNGDNNNGDGQNQNPNSVDQIQLSTTLRTPRRSTAANDIGFSEVFEPQTVYTRRCNSEKRSTGKGVAKPSSGSWGKRIRSAGELNKADGSLVTSKRQRVPRGKKKANIDAYIEEQKAYFEAIDAEKLEEESE